MSQAALQLCEALRDLEFSFPVACVYNPLEYAWQAYRSYLERHARTRKRVLYLGMNPGPWGMAQTGIPFGEVRAVRDWLQIDAPIDRPDPEHPKRPITGMNCTRSEVSGRRLWGLFADRFGAPADFFREQFVANYCPLVFMDEGGRNVTPDKIASSEFGPLRAACDLHLQKTLDTLRPEFLVGVGQFAEQCLARVAGETQHPPRRVIRILHPSPASPAANRDWAGSVEKVLIESGIWEKK
jgi:single-strand selective monofunctional uracil DNA glycosylase